MNNVSLQLWKTLEKRLSDKHPQLMSHTQPDSSESSSTWISWDHFHEKSENILREIGSKEVTQLGAETILDVFPQFNNLISGLKTEDELLLALSKWGCPLSHGTVNMEYKAASGFQYLDVNFSEGAKFSDFYMYWFAGAIKKLVSELTQQEPQFELRKGQNWFSWRAPIDQEITVEGLLGTMRNYISDTSNQPVMHIDSMNNFHLHGRRICKLTNSEARILNELSHTPDMTAQFSSQSRVFTEDIIKKIRAKLKNGGIVLRKNGQQLSMTYKNLDDMGNSLSI